MTRARRPRSHRSWRTSRACPRSFAGTAADPTAIGLSADGDRRVVVDLARPAADFPSIASSPPFGIVPASMTERDVPLAAQGFVGSGGYRVTGVRATSSSSPRMTTTGPARRRSSRSTWSPTSAGGAPSRRSRTATSMSRPSSSSTPRWIAYDDALGPQLRQGAVALARATTASTRRSRRSTTSGSARRSRGPSTGGGSSSLVAGPTATVATGMVPPGIPGRSDTRLPARPTTPTERAALLAEAGYPGGKGFPETTFMTFGAPYDDGRRRRDQEAARGRPGLRGLDTATTSRGSPSDPPQMWSMGWVADYPSPNDFLGILLGTGSSNNYGRWSQPATSTRRSPTALATTDPAAARAAFDTAEGIVRDEAPVIPLTYDNELVAGPDRAARGARERPRDHPRWQGWRGRRPMTPRRRFGRRRRGRRVLVDARCRRPSVVAPAVAAARDVRHADRVLDLRHVDQLQAAGRRSRRSPTGRAAVADARPAGPGVIDGRRADRGRAPRRSGSAARSPTATSSRTRRFVARWRVTRRRRQDVGRPPVAPDLRRHAVRLEDAEGQPRPGSLVPGRRRVRPAGAEDRRRRRRPRPRSSSA